MGKYKMWIQISILLAIAVVGVFTIANSFKSEHKLLKVGDQAPDFTLPGLHGGNYQLSDNKGKVVLVNFWGTFCPPCVEEMPAIQNVYEKYSGEHFEVLGVNLDEGAVTVENFVNQYALTFPILMDKSVIRKQYGVSSYPTTFVIDPDGKIVNIIKILMTEPFIERVVTGLMPK